MVLTFRFNGRTRGALGTHQTYTVKTRGLTIKACFLSLYDSYEHIYSPMVVYNGLELRFNREDYTLSFTSQWSHLGYEKVTTDTGMVCFFKLDSEGVGQYIASHKIAQLEMIRKDGLTI